MVSKVIDSLADVPDPDDYSGGLEIYRRRIGIPDEEKVPPAMDDYWYCVFGQMEAIYATLSACEDLFATHIDAEWVYEICAHDIGLSIKVVNMLYETTLFVMRQYPDAQNYWDRVIFDLVIPHNFNRKKNGIQVVDKNLIIKALGLDLDIEKYIGNLDDVLQIVFRFGLCALRSVDRPIYTSSEYLRTFIEFFNKLDETDQMRLFVPPVSAIVERLITNPKTHRVLKNELLNVFGDYLRPATVT